MRGVSLARAGLLALALAACGLGPSAARAAPRTVQTQLDLSASANFIMPTAGVPVGTVTWGDTTYRLDARVFHTRDAALGWYPDQVSLPVPSDARSALAVQILVNLDAMSADFSGEKVGEVGLTWQNGAEQTVDLVAGSNVRGWLLSDSNGPLQDAGSHEVYRGQDVYGRTAVIDSLTLVADPSVRDFGLAKVTIRDTSFDTADSLDPGLVVRGVTVISSPRASGSGD